VRRPLVLALLVAACAHPPRRPATPPDELDDPAARPARAASLVGYRAAYRLSWAGARIGDARERLVADAAALGGYRFERRERVSVRRGGTGSSATTTVTIDVDENLRARRVVVERQSGPTRTRGEAVRVAGETWRVTSGAGPVRLLDGGAVPATLVPLLVAGAPPGRAFEGRILHEGAGLAQARLALDITPDGRRAFALISTAAGDLRAEARLDERGFLAAAGAPAGLASERVADESALDAPFDPPEIVDSAAITVRGALVPGAPLRLRIHDVGARPPTVPDCASQRIAVHDRAWDVTLGPAARPRAAELLVDLRERTRDVARLLEKDLGLATLASDEALAAGRGDCTAHALVLHDALRERGYAARLVTGYVLDDGALRRHRWVLVQVAGDWVPVDPMFGEVPASPAHLALAVHGAGPDELAFVDDIAFAGWDHARAELY
jgi:transglutaminase-like putative cysteine protease